MATKITLDASQLTSATIFDDLKKVYYCNKKIEHAAELSATLTLQQLPITEDGVTFNMGGVNTTFKKLNTGEIWGSTVDRDDPEVSFNVASVSAAVNKLFMSEISDSEKPAVGKVIDFNFPEDGVSEASTFTAQGYGLELKAVEGSLWFPSENGDGWVVLPKIKMYGGLNGTDDSNTAYFACQVTPQKNDEGSSLYIFSKDKNADNVGS